MALARPGSSPDGYDPPERQANATASFAQEVESYALENFGPHLRADYLRLKGGVALPKDRMEAVQQALQARFAGAYADV